MERAYQVFPLNGIAYSIFGNSKCGDLDFELFDQYLGLRSHELSGP